MICIFLTLILTIFASVIVGLVVFTIGAIPGVFSFFYYSIPIAKLATIETFIEIGIILYFILTRIFRRNKVIKIVSILVIIVLAVISIYLSFRFKGKIIFNSDIPIIGNIYDTIYHFFDNNLEKFNNFLHGK